MISFKLFFRYLNVGILAVVFILLASMFLTSSKAHASGKIYKIDLQQDRSQSRVSETMQLLKLLSQQSSVSNSVVTVPVTLKAQYFPSYYSGVNMLSEFVGYWFTDSQFGKVFVGLEQSEHASIYILALDKAGSWSLWLPDSDLRYQDFLSYVKRTLPKPMTNVVRNIACSKLF